MENNEKTEISSQDNKSSSYMFAVAAILIMLCVSVILYMKVYKHDRELQLLASRLKSLDSYTVCTVNFQRLYTEIPAKVSLDPKMTQEDLNVYNARTTEILEKGLPECSVIVLQGVIFGNKEFKDVTDKVISAVFASK